MVVVCRDVAAGGLHKQPARHGKRLGGRLGQRPAGAIAAAATRHAFSGQALVIVRGLRDAVGMITLRAEAEGLQAAELVLNSAMR